MVYIGGVTDAFGKIRFTCLDTDLASVILNTQGAWQGSRKDDPEVCYFIAPLAESDGKIPVLDPAALAATRQGGCRGC